MSIAKRLNRISVNDYLAAELVSPLKHEYRGGLVYAMAGLTNLHNGISGNTLAAVHSRLRGKRCKACGSGTKIRIRSVAEIRFYYPDASVTCRPNPPNDSFQDEPKVIFEVPSRSTRRFDEVEKKDAYLTIPSLDVYALIEHEMPLVVVFRRTETGFDQEVYEGLDDVLPLPEIGIELPLAAIYEAVEFSPEDQPDE
jgi:Uma2 family endonuclease